MHITAFKKPSLKRHREEERKTDREIEREREKEGPLNTLQEDVVTYDNKLFKKKKRDKAKTN